jgi:hypothetical protein
VAESDANQLVLDRIAALATALPKPLLNAPRKVARLTRDGVWSLLAGTPGLAQPFNIRASRAQVESIAAGETGVEDLLAGAGFPIIARPTGSHAGEGLEKLADTAALQTYVAAHPAENFYLAPFTDYRNADGLFRKYRLAIVDGEPFAVHLAISNNWMIHYLNADMMGNPVNRAEEARFMDEFQSDFAVRHAAALKEIHRRTGLDYLQIDCSETASGELLIFEIGTAMIVHSLDPVTLFPYKSAHMNAIFEAFETMLRSRVEGA